MEENQKDMVKQMQKKLNKWNNFRVQKSIVINKYLI